MKTIFTLGALLMALTSQSFACDKLMEGQYFCVYKDGAITQKTIDYGTDENGRYLIYNGEEEKFYLNGNPTTISEDGQLLNVTAFCSEDQKTAHIQANIYGTDQVIADLSFTASHSPGMNYKASYPDKSEDEEAYCYRKFSRE